MVLDLLGFALIPRLALASLDGVHVAAGNVSRDKRWRDEGGNGVALLLQHTLDRPGRGDGGKQRMCDW